VLDDNHVTIDNCTVCKNRMACSRRFGVMVTVVGVGANLMHASVSCCEMPVVNVICPPRNWKAAEERLWDLLAHYNQWTELGRRNLKYICELMTRCILNKERTAVLYEEIFSYQEREVK
jgi:hypothetical protein